jgi:cell division protein FtsQ
MPKVEQPRPKFQWRTALRVTVWGLALAAVGFAAKEARSFLRSDPRFGLADLEVRGATYTSRARIDAVFAPDFSRSLYDIPLDERRRHLLAIDWIRTASVSRIWPSRIVVSLTERTPVAFAKLAIAGSSHYRLGLLDQEGVLLSLPAKSHFRLPVLSGVTEEQSEKDRAARVNAMHHLLEDLAGDAKSVTEVNAANIADMRVIADLNGQGVELWLGDQHYRSRYRNFLKHYEDIRRHSDNASVFDLRLDDRILAR